MKFVEVDSDTFADLCKEVSRCDKNVIYGAATDYGYEILDYVINYAVYPFKKEIDAKEFVAEIYDCAEVKLQMDLFQFI